MWYVNRGSDYLYISFDGAVVHWVEHFYLATGFVSYMDASRLAKKYGASVVKLPA